MTTIKSFVTRLDKIGVKVQLIGNYPWVYLDKINDIKVKGTYMAMHGFTIFFVGIKKENGIFQDKITDIPIIFAKIRETLCLYKGEEKLN